MFLELTVCTLISKLVTVKIYLWNFFLVNVRDRFSTECFCCLCYRGPLCLLRVELGVLTNGRLGTVEMVSEYIKHEQAEEVNTILDNISLGVRGES